ncbi:MAG: 23S rRNA (guanosine(2251)-2'-O)-methyltransferase RlmB [Candidatus Hydrogenedentes bacterium]|nr:23S rRNA (guanosine(2251)-2'-O)-methyltransferase RlmB [Candidatus Hydrogenedentota bacterium]
MRDRVVGRIPVLECLRAGKRTARRLFVMRGAQGIDDVRAAAQGIPIEETDRNRLDQLSGGVVHQGVVLEADALPLLDAALWARGAFPDQAVVVILDGVEDPHNFGAIVRSAAACGACAVLFGKDRSAPISAAAMKSAAGAMEYIDLVQATNVSRAIDDLKKVGFWIAGLDAEADKSIWEADLKGRIGLVIGSEGKGIRRLVREHCDFHLRIPLSGPITSLNASVSAAIAIAECMRQRQQG